MTDWGQIKQGFKMCFRPHTKQRLSSKLDRMCFNSEQSSGCIVSSLCCGRATAAMQKTQPWLLCSTACTGRNTCSSTCNGTNTCSSTCNGINTCSSRHDGRITSNSTCNGRNTCSSTWHGRNTCSNAGNGSDPCSNTCNGTHAYRGRPTCNTVTHATASSGQGVIDDQHLSALQQETVALPRQGQGQGQGQGSCQQPSASLAHCAPWH